MPGKRRRTTPKTTGVRTEFSLALAYGLALERLAKQTGRSIQVEIEIAVQAHLHLHGIPFIQQVDPRALPPG